MRFDCQSPFTWEHLNKKVRQTLGCQSNVFVYRGTHQALFETCLGLHLRFSHKRKLIAEVGLGDHYKNLEVEMAKLGVRFKSRFEDEMEKEVKQSLVYIHDLDDSLTAELYNHIETLKKLATTKLYRIHIAHHLFLQKKTFIQKLSDFDIIICALNQKYALVFTGEKVVLPVLTVGQLSWDLERDYLEILPFIDSDQKSYQPEISEFEANLPEGLLPWFQTEDKRIFDRSVVVLKNDDASALLELMAEEGIKAEGLGCHNPIEAASYCRWENQTWFDQASQFSRTEEDMRGLLAISGETLTDPNFKQKLTSALEKLHKLST